MMVLKMKGFKKQTNHAKYFLRIFQIRDAGGFVESQPFSFDESLIQPPCKLGSNTPSFIV